MKMIDMTCPKCGATMKLDLDKRKAVCEYCGNTVLLEQEDTLEEIRAKAQSRAYGYHKGRLAAEEEASKRKKHRSIKIAAIIVGAFVLIEMLSFLIVETAKPKINPFDYLEVSFRGVDGKGEVVLNVVNPAENIDTGSIKFTVSKDDYLMQGETISISAASTEYRFTEDKRIYTVEGLDEYLKDLDNLSEEALDTIHTRAETGLKWNLENVKERRMLTEMTPVKLFLITDGKQANRLYDVFEIHLTTSAGEKTCYVVTYFKDVVVREGEQVSIEMSGGMYIGHLYSVENWLYIMAYDSLEEVRAEILTNQDSYMELKELDL
ncbi:MAG: hypothetical protein J6B43_12410 [Lachnospiraceae bacterium]|nr:hypothetical protein [Lachnospiraceae bacterium]